MIQTARLRRAWTAICTYYQQAEQDRSKVQASDLDTLLDETELRDSKTAFWRRYRQRFPPEIHPADSTISRVSREMSKRMLCIFNVWKVKTLQRQLLTSQKKRKLGENLFTEEAEEEPTCEHTVEAYLDRLHALLIAYAMAGVAAPKSSDSAFDAKNEATLGADSTGRCMHWCHLMCARSTSSEPRRQSWPYQPPSAWHGCPLVMLRKELNGHRVSERALPAWGPS